MVAIVLVGAVESCILQRNYRIWGILRPWRQMREAVS